MDNDHLPDRPRFVVGLGNPGRKYASTRHNVGFGVIEVLKRRWQVASGREAFGGMLYDARVTGPDQTQQRVMMLTPLSYMNNSGRPVRELTTFYKASPDEILIVLDDMALELGQLRARRAGSAGGHNGLADIHTQLGSNEVPRLRIGIDRSPPYMDSADYVLAPFRNDEMETIEHAVAKAARAVEDWVFNGIKYIMDKYNPKA